MTFATTVLTLYPEMFPGPLGHSLAEALVPLCNWGADNMEAVAQIFAEREEWQATTGDAATG